MHAPHLHFGISGFTFLSSAEEHCEVSRNGVDPSEDEDAWLLRRHLGSSDGLRECWLVSERAERLERCGNKVVINQNCNQSLTCDENSKTKMMMLHAARSARILARTWRTDPLTPFDFLRADIGPLTISTRNIPGDPNIKPSTPLMASMSPGADPQFTSAPELVKSVPGNLQTPSIGDQ